jgi:arsenate reductase-like glutaredoxin family protein
LQEGADLVERDIVARRLSEAELQAIASLVPVDGIFSWNSPSARARGLRRGEVSDSEMISLMAAEPRLIRRPLVMAGGRLVVGFGAGARDDLRSMLARGPGIGSQS